MITIKRLLFGTILKAKSIMRSIRCMNHIHLGDYVIYDGKLCFVNNGVSAPFWDLCEKSFKEDGTRDTYRVHEDDFKKELSWYNLKNGLISLHRWYMNYWYDIQLREMLEKHA